MVADGHITDVPLDSVYSGVVSLRGLRLVLFLAELNDLDTYATDIGNSYLEAETNKKFYHCREGIWPISWTSSCDKAGFIRIKNFWSKTA